MADVEEDAEFGSHFLDSMLEVEMTEEDNELDVSKNDDPLDTLPPIPTFDLQSETISYKDVYRNAIPQPVIASLPLAASNTSNIPLVLKPSSMLLYSGEAPPPKPAPILAPVQRIPSKSNATSQAKQAKHVNASIDVKKNKTVVPESPAKFINEVFKAEFVKKVFVKSDPPWDISLVSDEEMKYYKDCFKDVTKVQNCRLHCTICDKHIGCAMTVEKKINVHSMLKVLTCKPCFEFYGDGNFPCDKGDNCEIYCRWCGQGGALICCSFCPSVFCKRCVKRNFGPNFLKSLEKASDWACFRCAQKPLWPHRAVCRALLEFLAKKKTDPKTPLKDTSSCCKAAGLTRKKLREAVEKGKVSTSQVQSPLAKASPAAKTPDPKIKTPSPAKAGRGRGRLLLKPIVQLKASDRVKIPLNTNGNSRPGALSSIFSPRSIISGNSIIRGITTSGPAKVVSSFPSPQLIQSPVIHGETLITPPSRLLVQAKTPVNPSQNSSYVRVSLTHQTPQLDVNKMPTVKIPHEVQGLVLRLIFPDNKMHYVRLAPDGSGCKASKDFPMPQFKEQGASFVEENLAEAFKISKMLYEKLLRIREKVNSRTKFTEESVFNSSVKKLHLAYEKTMELFKDLDKTLLENHEEWKNGAKNAVDVIDISDDETATVKKSKPSKYSSIREKCKKLSDDSDIEILEDIVVNGKTPASSNYKEKYRLRSSTDQAKTPSTGAGPGRKRKRGRLRRNNKRLKTTKMQNGRPEEPEEDPLKTDPLELAPDEPAKNGPESEEASRLGEEMTANETPSEPEERRKSGEGESEAEVNGTEEETEQATGETGSAKERASESPSAEPESSEPGLA